MCCAFETPILLVPATCHPLPPCSTKDPKDPAGLAQKTRTPLFSDPKKPPCSILPTDQRIQLRFRPRLGFRKTSPCTSFQPVSSAASWRGGRSFPRHREWWARMAVRVTGRDLRNSYTGIPWIGKKVLKKRYLWDAFASIECGGPFFHTHRARVAVWRADPSAEHGPHLELGGSGVANRCNRGDRKVGLLTEEQGDLKHKPHCKIPSPLKDER